MTRRAASAWLIAILAVAAFLRLFDLASNPAGLFRDEAEKGYSAWSLARTGCILDLTDIPADPATHTTPDPSFVPVARRWPLFVNVWGSQTSTIYQFADVPFVALLGPTWVAVRLPAALAGILTVFLTWGLARELTRDERVGLWAAALVAAGPWDVVLSRWAHQGIFVPAFMTAGVWAAVRAWRSERAGRAAGTLRRPEARGVQEIAGGSGESGTGVPPVSRTLAPSGNGTGGTPVLLSPPSLTPSASMDNGESTGVANVAMQTDRFVTLSVLFALAAAAQALAFYTYSGARPFLLAFWTGAALLYWRGGWARRRALWPAGIVFLALLAPSVWAMLGHGGAGMGRFGRVSIFGAGLSPFETAWLFVSNYAAHFSPMFLFFTGDDNLRQGVPGFGVLLAIEAVWLPAGLCWMLRHRSGRRSRGNRLLLLWLVLFPMSAALTREGIPHALRTLHAVPAPQIVGAIGAVACCDWLKRRSGRLMGALPLALTALNGVWFATALFITYPQQSGPTFEQGIAKAVARFREVSAQDPRPAGRLHVVPGAGLPFIYEPFLFHLGTDPATLRGLPLEKYPVQAVAPSRLSEKMLLALPPKDGLLKSGDPIPVSANDRGFGFGEIPPGFAMERFAVVPLGPGAPASQTLDQYVLYWRPR